MLDLTNTDTSGESTASMRVGSAEHLTLLCRVFIDTHRSFEPAELPWPNLDQADTARLRGLPIWDEAIRTERRTGAKVRAYAAQESPALLRQAVELQGFEETRHARLLETLIARYGIATDPGPERPLPHDLEAAFMRTGYGECIDSFFAFGLFAMARDARFLPEALLDLLEPIVEEEARHILFLVNWVAYKRCQRPLWRQPWHRVRCLAAFAGAAFDRARTAGAVARGGSAGGAEGFTATAADAVSPDFTVRGFIARCLEENERRFSAYDPRLLRPRVVPRLARAYLTLGGLRSRRAPGTPAEAS